MVDLVQGCRFVVYTCPETKPQMVPTGIDIGLEGLALIQGQICNPVVLLIHVFVPSDLKKIYRSIFLQRYNGNEIVKREFHSRY